LCEYTVFRVVAISFCLNHFEYFLKIGSNEKVQPLSAHYEKHFIAYLIVQNYAAVIC